MIHALFAARQRLPVLLQAERSECGLACLAMIASYYGYRTNLNALRQQFAVSNRGTSLGDLLRIAHALRLQSRALRLEPEELHNLALPAILHWDMGHFVVLKAITRQGFVLHDPAVGRRVCTAKALGKHFTGVAVECVPARNFEKALRVDTTTLSELFTRFPGFVSAVAQLFVLSLLIQLVTIASAFYLQLVIDESIAKNDSDLLLVLLTGFTIVMLIQVAMRFARATVQLYFANQVGFQMAGNVMSHLMKLPVDFFSKRHVGDLVSRFASLGEIRKILAEDMITVVLDGVFASTVLIVLFYFQPVLSAVVLGFILPLCVFKLSLVAPIKTLTEQRILAEAKTTSALMESMRAIEIVKFYCRELQRLMSWRNLYAEQINASVHLSRFGIRIDVVYGVIAGFENLLVIFLAARFVLAGEMSLGFMSAFLALKSNFTQSVYSLIDKLVQIRLMKLQLERVSDITCAKAETHDLYLPNPQPSVQGGLRLKDVAYQYDAHSNAVLQGINVQINAGEIVAIVGPSGAGKSTLIKLLCGLLFPTQGALEVDDVPLSNRSVHGFRSACAGVLQGEQLLSGTVQENICLSEEAVDLPRLERACQLACIHDFIQHLPMAYNSLIGDMGSIMSAGQAQRVLLARAFYKQARVLFLDEATANLDLEIEQQVLRAIQALGITTVMVTHRQAPLAIAHRVLLCQNAGVQEIAKPQ